MRTAEAAGVTGVITTKGTTDPFSAKALRGAMGSTFRLPVWMNRDFPQTVAWCREHSIQIVCADAAARRSYLEIDWQKPTALVMGTESAGLTPAEVSAADQVVSIPMKGPTESLNVAVAAGILLFEAARHR